MAIAMILILGACFFCSMGRYMLGSMGDMPVFWLDVLMETRNGSLADYNFIPLVVLQRLNMEIFGGIIGGLLGSKIILSLGVGQSFINANHYYLYCIIVGILIGKFSGRK